MIKTTDLAPTMSMAAAPKLTPAQKNTLLALTKEPKFYEASYKPLEKLMSLGYAERKFKYGKMYSMHVYYEATPAGVDRARQLQASKDAASDAQVA